MPDSSARPQHSFSGNLLANSSLVCREKLPISPAPFLYFISNQLTEEKIIKKMFHRRPPPLVRRAFLRLFHPGSIPSFYPKPRPNQADDRQFQSMFAESV